MEAGGLQTDECLVDEILRVVCDEIFSLRFVDLYLETQKQELAKF